MENTENARLLCFVLRQVLTVHPVVMADIMPDREHVSMFARLVFQL